MILKNNNSTFTLTIESDSMCTSVLCSYAIIALKEVIALSNLDKVVAVNVLSLIVSVTTQ